MGSEIFKLKSSNHTNFPPWSLFQIFCLCDKNLSLSSTYFVSDTIFSTFLCTISFILNNPLSINTLFYI